MGTNFYWVEKRKAEAAREDEDGYPYTDREERHIGKRSGAGLYCWDCGVTLCKLGEGGIHYGSHLEDRRVRWHDACPRCGNVQDPRAAGKMIGPIAVELGFAEPEATRPRGVAGCSSFSWDEQPESVLEYCRSHPDERAVEDEYGRVMACAEFVQMLDANCPVRFTEFIGRRFS